VNSNQLTTAEEIIQKINKAREQLDTYSDEIAKLNRMVEENRNAIGFYAKQGYTHQIKELREKRYVLNMDLIGSIYQHKNLFEFDFSDELKNFEKELQRWYPQQLQKACDAYLQKFPQRFIHLRTHENYIKLDSVLKGFCELLDRALILPLLKYVSNIFLLFDPEKQYYLFDQAIMEYENSTRLVNENYDIFIDTYRSDNFFENKNNSFFISHVKSDEIKSDLPFDYFISNCQSKLDKYFETAIPVKGETACVDYNSVIPVFVANIQGVFEKMIDSLVNKILIQKLKIKTKMDEENILIFNKDDSEITRLMVRLKQHFKIVDIKENDPDLIKVTSDKGWLIAVNDALDYLDHHKDKGWSFSHQAGGSIDARRFIQNLFSMKDISEENIQREVLKFIAGDKGYTSKSGNGRYSRISYFWNIFTDKQKTMLVDKYKERKQKNFINFFDKSGELASFASEAEFSELNKDVRKALTSQIMQVTQKK